LAVIARSAVGIGHGELGHGESGEFVPPAGQIAQISMKKSANYALIATVPSSSLAYNQGVVE
jgi:hypothetical protein